MNKTFFQKRVQMFFQEALKQSAGNPELHRLHEILWEANDRLHQPMRVAIVGLIKAGKSSLMNAFLGEVVVATGRLETSFNVNWLRYGDECAIRIHYKDDRPVENRTAKDLEILTCRSDENYDELRSIEFIEVIYPNPLLKIFDLIDTPGFASAYEDDTENSKWFLAMYGEELSASTEHQASKADAVLYVFSQNIGTHDETIMEEFQGKLLGHTTPLNAIGILTQIDHFWPERQDPLLAAEDISSRLTKHPELKRLFYSIFPVSALLASGAQNLTIDDLKSLQQLAELPEQRLKSLLSDIRRLEQRDYEDISVGPSVRQHLSQQFGRYGIWKACQLIRSGISEQEQLRADLLAASGLSILRNTIVSHFGSRAFLIKTNTVFQQIKSVCFTVQKQLVPDQAQIVEEITTQIEIIETEEHAFQELNVLRKLYKNKLEFNTEEIEQLLQVTGEYGACLGDRLGLEQGERATVTEMRPVAEKRLRYWRQKCLDLSIDRDTIGSANVLIRSFERVLHHLDKVEQYIYL